MLEPAWITEEHTTRAIDLDLQLDSFRGGRGHLRGVLHNLAEVYECRFDSELPGSLPRDGSEGPTPPRGVLEPFERGSGVPPPPRESRSRRQATTTCPGYLLNLAAQTIETLLLPLVVGFALPPTREDPSSTKTLGL